MSVTNPLEVVVSDMICIKHIGIKLEWTYLLDVYNNEIIASSITRKAGNSLPYYTYADVLVVYEKFNEYLRKRALLSEDI